MMYKYYVFVEAIRIYPCCLAESTFPIPLSQYQNCLNATFFVVAVYIVEFCIQITHNPGQLRIGNSNFSARGYSNHVR